jgi:hypothetical protein
MYRKIAKYGTPTTKRIYAIDEAKCRRMENCFVRICNHTKQYSYTVGKNSSDSAMIIDAMDLLYLISRWFCIVSSDSDFTRLAIRLRESGMKVIGMGRKHLIPLLLPVIVLFISKFWMVPFRKSKKRSSTTDTKKTSWKNG